jgi:hypothetical protein
MNKELTAVEGLWKQIDNAIPHQNITTSQVFNGLLEEAKELHRQQIIDAITSFTGLNHHSPNECQSTKDAEQYYNNKYGQ